MATTTAGVAFTVTQGFYCDGQRFQYVSRWARTGGAAFDALNVLRDVRDWITGNFLPPWQAAMSSSVEFVGWSVEPVVAGVCIPYRQNYPLGTHIGSQAAPVYSQNVSMLGVGYSSDQIALGLRVATAKTFFGPPPEDVIDTQVLKAAYENNFLDDLVLHMFQFYTGNVTNTTYARVFGALTQPTPAPTDVQYPIDIWETRNTVFTQRRRLSSIL